LHFVNKAGGHELKTGEDSTFEMVSGSTRSTSVLHVSTLEARATEVISEHTSQRFSSKNKTGSTVKTSSGSKAALLLTVGVKERGVQVAGETEGVSDFVHHTDHVLFM